MTEANHKDRARGPWWRAATVGVLVLAGTGFATAGVASADGDLRPANAGLADVVRARDAVVAERAARVDTLRGEVDALVQARAPRSERIRELTAQGDAIAPSAGATAVHGPGLTVQLDDSKLDPDHPPAGLTRADMVVHQQDVQAVVNALWEGGAEGIMVQDQRIVSTSAVRCVGSTLILQGRVYAPPYTVTAIGDAQKMKAALDADSTLKIYRQYVDAAGLGYEVTTHDDVTLPAFAGNVEPQIAGVKR